MSITIEERAARTRCYQCGAVEPASVCHHCGRPMCAKHQPEVVDAAGRPYSKEFDGLRLPNPAPYHCEDCDHTVRGKLTKPLVVSVLVALFGLVVLLSGGIVVGALVLAGGAGTAVWAFLTGRRNEERARRVRPDFPLLPHIDAARIREKLHGRIVLDDNGRYSSSITGFAGSAAVSMTFGRADQERLRAFRERFRIGKDEPVGFSAGYAVLRGRAGVEFTDTPDCSGVLPLFGMHHELPFLASDNGSARWTRRWDYRLNRTAEVDEIPMWITPSLVPESDQRALEIELQWIDFRPSGDQPEINRLEKLSLRVPVSWGTIERFSHTMAVGIAEDPDNPGGTVRVMEWNQLPLDRAGRRLTVSVRFEHRIDPADHVRGQADVSFTGGLSGLRGIEVHGPLGARRTDNDHREDARTRLTADFDLSLRGIRYQDVRVVPDRKNPDDLTRKEVDEFAGVIPDHETVIELTNALSAEDYYVKRVIENPPRSGGRANVVNRYWDIGGRCYDGVYPVNFHLTLTGEELHRGDIYAQSGNTKARLTVQGAFASEEMKRKIELEWDRLHEITSDTLNARATVAGPARLNGGNGHAPENGANRARAAELRKRRDDLTDALLEKRITEEMYREIVARIDQELWEL